MKLYNALKERQGGMLLYGLTPPKLNNSAEKNQKITERRIKRIQNVSLDGLVVYDIQDEESRTDSERPFPFLETVPSYLYAHEDLENLNIPRIVYLCVGKYSPEELDSILSSMEKAMIVFVGAPSPDYPAKTSLRAAYKIFAKHSDRLLLGGVTIPERHKTEHNEHERILGKTEAGCSFFISQCVFNVDLFKDVLSDYFHSCQKLEKEMQTVIMTLTPCGSEKTLDFIKWLGIEVPRWMQNELRHNRDILHYSMQQCRTIFLEIQDFCRDKNIPFGCNVESVAVQRDEVLASFDLAAEIRRLQL